MHCVAFDEYQVDVFLKCITDVFSKTNIKICELDLEIWNYLKDSFLKKLESFLHNNICWMIESSTRAIDDYKALQFFENVVNTNTFVTRIYKIYPELCEKFINEIKNLEKQFEVRQITMRC